MRILIFSLLTLFSGVLSASEESDVSETVRAYFDVYDERKDFEKLMSFYDESAIFNDVIYGKALKNKDEISQFLNWRQGSFESLTGEGIMTITSQLVDDQSVVTHGYFHTFKFNGETMGPWLFVILHEFDANNKIIRQTDWINYTPRESFLGGTNMNEFLIPKE